MFGGQHTGQSAFDPGGSSGGSAPWGSDASGSGLARDAGLNDIGRGDRTAGYDDGGSQRAGLFDSSGDNGSDFDGDEVDVGGDYGNDDTA